jgi:hypothetical protein
MGKDYKINGDKFIFIIKSKQPGYLADNRAVGYCSKNQLINLFLAPPGYGYGCFGCCCCWVVVDCWCGHRCHHHRRGCFDYC